MKDWVKKSFNVVVTYSFIIIFILGILSGIVFLISFFSDHRTIAHYSWEITRISIVSVLTSMLLKSATYIGIFKEAIKEVIFSREFLAKQKDLTDVWKNVSSALFSSKFEEIHQPFFDIITGKYFPNELCYYSRNSIEQLQIDWVDENTKDAIIISDYLEREVIAENESKIEFLSRRTTIPPTLDETKFKDFLEIEEYEVDGVSKKACFCSDPKLSVPNNGEIEVKIKGELVGKKKYKIKEKAKRVQILKKDNYFSFSSMFLVHGFDLTVYYPEDLQVDFYENGTIDKFENIPQTSPYRIRKRYDGLLLYHQGFLLTFHKK